MSLGVTNITQASLKGEDGILLEVGDLFLQLRDATLQTLVAFLMDKYETK